MTEPIISINDLSVYFNKKKAINNVTMISIQMKSQPYRAIWIRKINLASFYQQNGGLKP